MCTIFFISSWHRSLFAPNDVKTKEKNVTSIYEIQRRQQA